jgi:hypothetical protein
MDFKVLKTPERSRSFVLQGILAAGYVSPVADI